MKKLEVKNLVKSYGETKAVDDISFRAEAGQVFGLVGRNGAGKTTTIRTIMDIYVPDSGEILFNGAKRMPDFHQRVGYLPEERGLYKFMSVIDNLLFLAEIKGVSVSVARPRAMEYLKRFDLAKQSRAALDSLSKGNQQKVQFIGTILHSPDLVILDEPFSGLDPVNTNLFKDVILDLKRAGKIVILSTHAMDIAERLCDSIALISKGSLVLNAPVSDIKQRYSQSMVSLHADGDLSFLAALPYVLSVEIFGNTTSVQVRTDSDIQELLRALITRHVVVKKFQANEMSLHDIFVSLTRTREEALAGDEAAIEKQGNESNMEAAA
jgi:ABC-2 type transport system ATP-binding protein